MQNIQNQANSSPTKSVLTEKSFAFAIRIVRLYQYLKDQKQEYVLSKQILRSGTSIGANNQEAQNAETKSDFIHKLGIAQKECAETLYWLELLKATDYLTQAEFDSIAQDCTEILKILKSSIITAKKNKK